MFKLSGPKTYVTLHKKFKQGVLYPAEQVEGLVGVLNDSGTPLFVDAIEPEVEPVQTEAMIAEEVGLVEDEEKAPRKLIVGKKKEG